MTGRPRSQVLGLDESQCLVPGYPTETETGSVGETLTQFWFPGACLTYRVHTHSCGRQDRQLVWSPSTGRLVSLAH